MSFDPNADSFVIPTDASEAPPTLPAGRHGEHGEAEIVHAKVDFQKGKDDESIPYLSILVAVHHPELGRCNVGTGPFGALNTSLMPKSRSKAQAFATNLGLISKPGDPMTKDAMESLRGRKVIVDVSNRPYKAKDGSPALAAELKDIYLA